jgi:hypothetical protein
MQDIKSYYLPFFSKLFFESKNKPVMELKDLKHFMNY